MDGINELSHIDNAIANIGAYGADIDPNTGEVLSDEPEEALAKRRVEVAQNRMLLADSLRNDLANIDAKIAMFKEAIDALKKKKDEIAADIEKVEAPIIESIRKGGDIEADGYILTVHKNPPAVVEVDASLTPEKFMKTTVPKPVTKPDKVAIKKAIMGGEYVPGWGVTKGLTLSVKER